MDRGPIAVAGTGEAAPISLERLLDPRSIALLGASARAGSLGSDMLRVLRDGGYAGAIWPVNPGYAEIGGLACHASLAELPGPPDLVMIGVGATRVEAALRDAIAAGAGGAVVFNSCYAEGDDHLLDRLKDMAREARFPVCGGNGMGFYNFDARCMVSFQHSRHGVPGHIAAIVHSGSVFVHLANNDARFRFNFIASPGQEIAGTVADYIQYAITLPTTRAIALFIETVRDPVGFRAALASARRNGIPVVALKAARSSHGAALAATHSAAIAGNDAAFQALCDRHGVIRVFDLDEMMATAQLLACGKRPGAGGLGVLADSGGLRELLVDLADDMALPLAKLSGETTERLAQVLPHGLSPTNPVDAAGPLDEHYAEVFGHCLDALLGDENVALTAFEFEVRDDFMYQPELVEITERAAAATGKPLMVVHSFGAAQNQGVALRLADVGVPLINGVQNALKAVSHALRWRDWSERAPPVRDVEPAPLPRRWVDRFRSGGPLTEAEGYDLLRHYGLAAPPCEPVSSLEDALAAAGRVGYPVVLKTAMPGILHKTEAGGVKLGLRDRVAVAAAWEDLSSRLGPQVLVQRMLAKGVELALGLINDPQFGPVIVVSAGGTLIELVADRQVALAPVTPQEARAMLGRLRVSRLLSGYRGAPAADLDLVAGYVARCSEMALSLAPHVASMDINPVLVSEDGCVAADVLVIPR